MPAAPVEPEEAPRDPTSTGAGEAAVYAPRFAVALAALDALPVEGVAAALKPLARFSPAEVAELAEGHCGFLVDSLTQDEARALAAQLSSGGVPAAVVDGGWLTLPAPRVVKLARLEEDRFVTHDQYGRPAPTPLSDIRLVSVGWMPHGARTHEIRRESRHYREEGVGLAAGQLLPGYVHTYRHRLQVQEKVEVESRYEERLRLTLDLVLGAEAPRRLRLFADEVGLPDRGELTREERFLGLCRALCERARYAALNRGAHALREGAEDVRRYAQRRHFERESAWVWWRFVAGAPRV